jgi:pilus assembly protein Flp/PilA
MNNAFLKLHLKLQALEDSVDGQDLVEYGLLVSLIALVCISSVSQVAGSLNTIFTNVSTSLA